MEAVIIGLVKPVIDLVISIIRDMFITIVNLLITPFIKFLADNVAEIVENVLLPLAKIIILFIKPLMSIGMMFVFKLLASLVGTMIGEILKLATLPINFLEKNAFIVGVSGGMQLFAISMIILIAAYMGIKASLGYKGGDGDVEEPWKIMIRVGTAGFMVYSSIDICSYVFKFYYGLQGYIFSSFGMASDLSFDASMFGDTLSDNMFNTLDPVSQLFDVVVFLLIVWKLLILAVKFIERQIILMLYVVFSPITMACSVSSATRQTFALWAKTFIGNVLIQGIQITGVCLIFAIANSGAYKTNLFIGSNIMQNLLLLGCISVLLSAEAISYSVLGYFVGMDLGAVGFSNAKYHGQNILNTIYPATESLSTMAKSVGSTLKSTAQKNIDLKNLTRRR